MAIINLSLPEPLRDWVTHRVDSGDFENASAYVRDLIERDQSDARERDGLVKALIEGEQSGLSSRQIPDILAALKAELSGAKE